MSKWENMRKLSLRTVTIATLLFVVNTVQIGIDCTLTVVAKVPEAVQRDTTYTPLVMDYAQVESHLNQVYGDELINLVLHEIFNDKKYYTLPEGMTGPLEHVYIFNRENGISMTYAGDIKEAVYMPIKLIFQ